MLTTKRLLLGLLALGIVGMHGLVTSSGTAVAHHGWAAAPAALSAASAMTTAGHEHAATSADRDAATSDTRTAFLATSATPATSATSTSASPTEDGDESTSALALCMTLLLAVGAVAFGGRRTTWVADMRTPLRTDALPLPPVLRDSTPVPRFTVMRC